MNTARATGLLLGVAADAAFGDPRRGHPVAAFGKAAHALEQWAYQDRRSAGTVYTTVLVGGPIAVGVLVQRASRGKPVAETALTACTTWMVLGGASLATEGAAMAHLLGSDDLDGARGRLNNLCGRDAARLDAEGVARATVESIAENTSDAVVAPLVCGAIAGVPGLLGYRAANTLDAMVGHPSPRYRNFGWAAARLDDLVNLLPARLGAALAAVGAPVVGGSPSTSWHVRKRDAAAHPSPNAGQLESAFAGALRIQLGGRTIYRRHVEQRPVLGQGRTAAAGDVTRAVALSRVVRVSSAVLAAAAALLCGRKPQARG